MPLSQAQKTQAAAAFRLAADETIRLPLWTFHPLYAPFVLHERRVRFQWDNEPIGDHEYT